MTLDEEDFKVIEQMLNDLFQRMTQKKEVQIDAAFLASLSQDEYNAIMEPRFRGKK